MDALDFAKTVTDITQEDIDIVIHSRRSVLVDGESIWMKKDSPEFDVTMGSFVGAEVCELVGLFILHKMQEIVAKEMCGLYRDDGLIAVVGGGQEAERIRKKLFNLFKGLGLRITAEANLKTVQFLDVILDLSDESFKPYIKANRRVQYVSVESNHPPSIIKNIPEGINKRLENISSCGVKFEENILPFQEGLNRAGYEHKLIYRDHQNSQRSKKRNRQRNIIWFNPPFSSNIKTRIGEEFFKILNKHFPKGSKFHKLFNKNNVKLSYSCMPSMKSVISGHNQKLLRENREDMMYDDECVCNEDECLLSGNCQKREVVYRAVVKSENVEKNTSGRQNAHLKKDIRNMQIASRANLCLREVN